MRKRMKRLTAFVTALCMIVGILLQNAGTMNVQAASRATDEYGHTVTIPEDFDAEDGVNPYGSGPVNFNPVVELGVYESWDQGSAESIYQLDKDDRLASKVYGTGSGPYYAHTDSGEWLSSSRGVGGRTALTTSSSEGDLRLPSGITLDAAGTGRNSYTVYCGFFGRSPEFQVESFKNTAKKKASYSHSLWSPGGYAWYSNNPTRVTFDNAEGYTALAAGDFDNDGKETVVVYDPYWQGSKLEEFIVNEDGEKDEASTFNLGGNSVIRDRLKEYLNGETLNEYQSKQDPDMCDVARVSMTAANVDKDDADELLVTISTPFYGSKHAPSVLLILDKEGKEWKISYSRKLEDVFITKDGTDMRRNVVNGATDVADVDGDGEVEIITAGMLLNSDGTGTDVSGYCTVITEPNFDGKGYSYQTTKVDNKVVPAGCYLKGGRGVDGNEVDWTVLGSNPIYYGPISMACARLDGFGSREYLVIRGEIFYMDTDGFSLLSTNQPHYDDVLKGFTGVSKPVVGNFDGNKQGKEQIFWIESKRYSGQYALMHIGGYRYNGDTTASDDPDHVQSCAWRVRGSGYYYDHASAALTAPDVDTDDGVAIRYNTKQYTYAKPEVMAILEAAPYFEDLANNGSGYYDSTGATAFGISSGTGSGSSSSSSTRAGAYISYEYDLNVFGVTIASFGAEAAYEAEWSKELEYETSYTYETIFTGHQEDNSVILIYTPVIVYTYDVFNNKTKKWESAAMNISLAQKPEYEILTIDDYNEVAAVCGGEQIGTDIISSTPGQPQTYRTNTIGLKNVVSAQQNLTAVKKGSGTIEQTITKETSKTLTTSLQHSFDAKVGGGSGGLTLGVSAGYSSSKAKSTTDTAGVIRSSDVSYVPNDNYSFSYKFVSWDETFGSGEDAYTVPVLGYVVQDVKQPPSLPKNVTANPDTNEVELSWESGECASAKYEIYRYLDTDPTGQHYYLVGTVDGTTFEFTHTGLKEGTQYQYCLRAVGAEGEVTDYTEPLAVVTASSEGVPRIIMQPEDASVLPDAKATFTVDAIPAGTTGLSYNWQMKGADGGSWKSISGSNNSTLTIASAGLDMDGNQYRCTIAELGNNERASFVYSNAAKLSVGKTGSTTTLTVKDEDGQSTNSGMASYTVTEDKKEDQEVTVQYQITVGDETGSYIRYENTYVGDDSAGNYVYYCQDDSKYYLLDDCDGLTPDEAGICTGTASQRTELTKLSNYLADDTGSIIAPADQLRTTVPETKEIDNAVYEVYTAEGVTLATVGEGAEAKGTIESLTLYYGPENDDGAAYYVLVKDENNADVLKEVEPVESYGDDNVITGAPYTYLASSLSRNWNEEPETDGDYTLYAYGEGDSAVILYEKDGTYYTKRESQYKELTVAAYGDDGKMGQISNNEVTNIAQLVSAPETVTITVTKPVETSVPGATVTLTANVTSNGGNPNGLVTYTIVNTTTGETTVIRQSTEKGTASANWTPATAGIYHITVNYAGSTTVKASKSRTFTYYALEEPEKTTGYGLNLSEKPQYGDTITADLYQWEIENDTITNSSTTGAEFSAYRYVGVTDDNKDSVDKNGFSTTAETWTNGTTLLPGDYLIKAKVGEDIVASKSLQVSKRTVTISAPEIEPISADHAADLNLADYLKDIKVTDSADKDYTLVGEYGNNYSDLLTLTSNCKTVVGSYDVYVTYTDNEGLQTDFLSKYAPDFRKSTLSVQIDSYEVTYDSGTNGTLNAYNATASSVSFTSGSAVTAGSKLLFIAKPDKNFRVSKWKINGETVNDNTEGITVKGDTLTVSSLSEDLDVSVVFTSESYTISFRSDEHGEVTASQGQTGIQTGTKVAGGSSVTFTARPEEGYIVKEWKIAEGIGTPVTETNEDGSGYVKDILTLDNISADMTVSVTFEESRECTVTYSAVDVNGAPATGVILNVDGLDENGRALKGSEIMMTAEVTPGTGIQEWQTSTDGVTWTAAASSQDSYKIYNLQSDLYIRLIVNASDGTVYNLQYAVVDEDGDSVAARGTVTASSRGQILTAGNNTAYIPVDFMFEETEDYEVKEWKVNNTSVQTGYDKLAYELSSLKENTTVAVVVQKKPQIVIAATDNGAVSAAYSLNGESVSPSENGYVYSGTDITVTLTPDTGYVVDQQSGIDYTVTDTDVMTYQVQDVDGDLELAPAFMALDEHLITYATVITTDDNANGSLTASASRKAMEVYEISELNSGASVYDGSTVTFTAGPDDGYRVGTWNVDGEVYKKDGIVYTGNVLELTDVTDAKNVTVQFVNRGDKTTVQAGENGWIEKAMVANVDQIENISEGFILSPDVELEITAVPDTGYQVSQWLVNNEVVQDGGNIYTYTAADGAGSQIIVRFEQIDYTVSWSNANGTVQAEAGSVYEGNMADIQGGTEVLFTASAADGYKLDHWTVNGERVVEGPEGNTFAWTVPNGAAANSAVTGYEVEAVCVRVPYTVTFDQPEHGSLSAVLDGQSIQTQDKVEGDRTLTFTAVPDSDYLVAGWIVDGETTDNRSVTLDVNITKDTTVGVILAKKVYEVSYDVTGKGTIETSEGRDGKVAVNYGESVTFSSQAGNYWIISEWQVDGQKVTDGVSGDGRSFTLSDVTEDHKVTAVFKAALQYTVGYSAEPEEPGTATGGSVSAEVNDNTSLNLDSGTTAQVYGDSKLTFTAAPDSGKMVTAWKVNGRTVENYLSNTYVIDSLGTNVLVTAVFGDYVGYEIPESAEEKGYTVTDIVRTPDDTTPESEIRKNGDLTFTVAPSEGFDILDSLIVNNYDCLKGKLVDGENQTAGCEKVEVKAGGDGTYTITIKNVAGEISFTASGHKHNLMRIDEKKATCTEDGMKEYWICTGGEGTCGKLFADASAKEETTEEELVLKKTGHAYGEPVFNWNGTSTATAVFTCSNCKDVQEVDCTISKVQEGEQVTYTATAAFDGKEYTDTKTEELPHAYGKPVFNWNGTSAAAAVFTCSNCKDVQKVDCTISKVQKDDQITYTATAAFDGKKYTDTKVEKLPHIYGKPVFTWNGTLSATATFTCTGCGEVSTVNCTVSSKTGEDQITYTAKAVFGGKTWTATKSEDITIADVDFLLKGRVTAKKVKLTWNRVPAASGYDIWRGKCGRGEKLVKSVENNTTRTWTYAKKGNSNYKYYVKAYKIVNGEKKYLNTSNKIHLAFSKKYTNVKKVKTVSKLRLKKGKKKKLSVEVTYEKKGRELVEHMRGFTYSTTDAKVASVTKKGIIKARSKGTCYIYVTAFSGAYAKVRVRVK